MDIQLARTFLEIVAAGNFVNASKRLFVTQSAVTLRVQKLEDEVGQSLFKRSKTGIELTPAGEQFERYARTIVKAWEDAKYHVAVPDGYDNNLIVGSQFSLWPRFGFRWLRLLERQLPRVTLRAELGLPQSLINLMNDGLLDIGIMYTPQLRPGLKVERLFEDNLVLVSTDPNYGPELDNRYVFVDWGEEFSAVHAMRFPEFSVSHVTLSVGALAARYIINRQRAGYLPARVANEFVSQGKLHIVPEAPVFPYPAYAVHSPGKQPELIALALSLLRRISQKTEDEQHNVLDDAGVDEYFDGHSIMDGDK